VAGAYEFRLIVAVLDGGDPPSVGDLRIVPRGPGHHLVKWEIGGYYQGSTKVQPPIPPVLNPRGRAQYRYRNSQPLRWVGITNSFGCCSGVTDFSALTM
jgi:hypothetical protein